MLRWGMRHTSDNIERYPADQRLENQLLSASPPPDVAIILRALKEGADPLLPMSLAWSRNSRRLPLPLLAVAERIFEGRLEVLEEMLQSGASPERTSKSIQRRLITLVAHTQDLPMWQLAYRQGYDFFSRWPKNKDGITGPLDLARVNHWPEGERWISGLLAERERRLLGAATAPSINPASRALRL